MGETAEAQTKNNAPEDTAAGTETPPPEEQSVLEWGHQLLDDWRQRWVITGEIAKSELTLSVRSLLLSLVFTTVIALLLVFAWLTALVLGVWLLYSAGVDMWMLLSGMLALHLLLALWLGLSIRRLLAEVGFKRTLAAVTAKTPDPGAEEPAA